MCLFSNNACKYDTQKWLNNRPSAYENLLLLNNIMMNRWYKWVKWVKWVKKGKVSLNQT